MIYLGDDVSTDSKTLIISSETNLIVGKKIKLVHRNFYQTSNNQLVLGFSNKLVIHTRLHPLYIFNFRGHKFH